MRSPGSLLPSPEVTFSIDVAPQTMEEPATVLGVGLPSQNDALMLEKAKQG